jgi:hypothetical protein
MFRHLLRKLNNKPVMYTSDAIQWMLVDGISMYSIQQFLSILLTVSVTANIAGGMNACFPQTALAFPSQKLYMKYISACFTLVNHATLFHCYHYFDTECNVRHTHTEYKIYFVIMWRLHHTHTKEKSRLNFEMLQCWNSSGLGKCLHLLLQIISAIS